ncbi:MAG TPA: hypothetical protein VGY30_07820 [Solirubrobacteraceae bacterium]|nr:hypothetical protein [Solirubrobacteraceae bacterium]
MAALLVVLVVIVPVVGARAAAPGGVLDGRAWELVSASQKDGGEVGVPGSAAAGVLQAAVAGGLLAYGSSASFGQAEGAAPVSQYLAVRGSEAWSSENLTPPLLSGTYTGDPYQLFSADLSRALLSNGWSCRAGEARCAAANPPLGPGAPVGYRNLYLREGDSYRPLLTTSDAPTLSLAAPDFQLALAGASTDLRHVVFSTCAALTVDASEVPGGGGGCESSSPNLYEWSDGTLVLINLLAGEGHGTPGARLAAPSGAISADGSRVYFTVGEGAALYLREGSAARLVSATGVFQVASADGRFAFLIDAGKLLRYDAQTASIGTPLASEVLGVLGASEDGSYVYYETPSGLYLWNAGASTPVALRAGAADTSDYPPAVGTARVTADGAHLAFLSSALLGGSTQTEVYVYEALAGRLICVSCDPKGAPVGPSTIPGAISVGEGPAAYKPRALSSDGNRLFFDSSDSLVGGDTNNRPDVYEWEAKGAGCGGVAGCVGLISGGRVGASTFVDASASGEDVFFATATSLLPFDFEAEDVYDARAGGGFPEPSAAIPCYGDACQGPPSAPEEQSPGTASFIGPGNPAPSSTEPPLKSSPKPKSRKSKHVKHRKKRMPRHHGGHK